METRFVIQPLGEKDEALFLGPFGPVITSGVFGPLRFDRFYGLLFSFIGLAGR
jgi:hypothetical protein